MYGVSVYHVPTEGDTFITPHFRVKEFACQDGSPICLVHPSLAKTLEAIRNAIGAPIIINSGYRTVAHNRKVGGAGNSMHMYGVAADISCPSKTVTQLRAACEQVLGQTGGYGKYKTYCHVDIRIKPARWQKI